jgi:hypothetical protein
MVVILAGLGAAAQLQKRIQHCTMGSADSALGSVYRMLTSVSFVENNQRLAMIPNVPPLGSSLHVYKCILLAFCLYSYLQPVVYTLLQYFVKDTASTRYITAETASISATLSVHIY